MKLSFLSTFLLMLTLLAGTARAVSHEEIETIKNRWCGLAVNSRRGTIGSLKELAQSIRIQVFPQPEEDTRAKLEERKGYAQAALEKLVPESRFSRYIQTDESLISFPTDRGEDRTTTLSELRADMTTLQEYLDELIAASRA